MRILKLWINLIVISFGITLFVFFIFSVIANGFDFSNFFAKFFVLLFVLGVLTGIVRLILWDKNFRNENLISMFIFGMFWVLLIGNMFFADDIYGIKKEYVGLSARETNDEDYVMATDYGERGEVYEYEDYYYLDPTIKSFVVNKNSAEYKRIRNTLEQKNEHVQERKYEFWQTAVVDGFYSKNTANSIEKGFYYFIELCHKTVPTLIFVLILNFIVQIFSRFEYSLLRAIYHPTEKETEEKYEDDAELNKLWDEIDSIMEEK